MFRLAGEKLIEFVKTPEYADFLRRKVRMFAQRYGAPGSVLKLRAQDMAYGQELADIYGNNCTVQQDDSIGIGGVVLENAASSFVEDETLDNLLSQQKEYFRTHSAFHIEGI